MNELIIPDDDVNYYVSIFENPSKWQTIVIHGKKRMNELKKRLTYAKIWYTIAYLNKKEKGE